MKNKINKTEDTLLEKEQFCDLSTNFVFILYAHSIKFNCYDFYTNENINKMKKSFNEKINKLLDTKDTITRKEIQSILAKVIFEISNTNYVQLDINLEIYYSNPELAYIKNGGEIVYSTSKYLLNSTMNNIKRNNYFIEMCQRGN